MKSLDKKYKVVALMILVFGLTVPMSIGLAHVQRELTPTLSDCYEKTIILQNGHGVTIYNSQVARDIWDKDTIRIFSWNAFLNQLPYGSIVNRIQFGFFAFWSTPIPYQLEPYSGAFLYQIDANTYAFTSCSMRTV